MTIYADTHFFTSLYCTGPNNAEAVRLDASIKSSSFEGYPITAIGRFDLINALQQSVFSTRQGVPGVRLTPEYALVIEAMFFKHLATGQYLRDAACNEAALEKQFRALSHRQTAKEGFRTYDIHHVSSALVLGCDTFWSFDARAKKLAKLEGLAVN